MKKKQTTSSQKREKVQTSQTQQKSDTDKLLRLGKQALVALVGLLLLTQVKKSVDGYRWMYDDLLKGNMETIKKYPKLSVDERYQMKMGFQIAFMNHIKAQTPDTAIILFPDSQIILNTKDPQQDLSGMGGWCSNKYGYFRFLYPRKVVFESEKGKSPFFEKMTHVAIINGWGYDYLETPVPTEFQVNNAILPIKNSTH